MNKYLDDNGLLYLWGKIKNLVSSSAGTGTVTQVKIGTTEYNPTTGVISLPAYPTTLPASDVESWAKASTKPSYTASEVGAVASTDKGVANGVATLDSNGKVPSSQLPSYVDDVIEAYGISGTTALTSGWLSTEANGTALTPEAGKIYILMANFPSVDPVYNTNSQFRWSGSAYVPIYDSGATSITNAEIDTIVAS